MITATDTSNREITSVRLLNAPRELVYEVWTKAEHILKWWGPEGFTNSNKEMNVSVGGVWRFTMHGPDGRDYPNKILFTEVVPNERLVYEHSDDTDGSSLQFHVTVTFEEEGNKTRLTMRMVFPTQEERDAVVREYGAMEGQTQTLNKLEEFIAVMLSENPPANAFVIRKELNAKREDVFNAFSNADALTKWWGPAGFDIVVKKLEFKPGGIFHYSMTANGMISWGRFIYRDIKAPERIVFINSFSDEDGGLASVPFSPTWPKEMLNVLTLKGEGDKTILTLIGGPLNATAEEHKTYEENYGNMEQGFGGTFKQLEDYLAGKL
ncbi:MAG: SRPBCC family protein [Flavipsychrobacter sp.]